MAQSVLFALPPIRLPNLALAEGPGSGTDLSKVPREVEAMQRDGRWQKLMADGQANKRAFEAMTQAEQQAQPRVIFKASSPTRPRRGR
jgi:hypothetical protein